ncbi:MAG: tetratricopeptide repeat protein [Bacteroidota bacterium]
MNRGDTSSAVKALMIDANIRGNLAHYKDAYDKLWQALFLADKAALMRQKADIYIEIGRHYSFYKRRLKALHYFQISKQLNLDLLRQAEVSEAALVSNYYAFCSTYRELGDYDLARQYLDSCFYYFVPQKSPIDRAFLQFELASIQTAERDYATALETYKAVQPWFEEFEPSYLVLFYTYLSDAYLGLEQYDESEKYYKKALQISDEYNMHIDFSVIIHEKLSDLYLQKGEYPNAYSSLKTVKELDAKFFDSRSDNNQSLLEIQDAFRQEQETQQKLIQEQKLERLEHEEDVWFLQRVILISSILFILTIGYLYFSYLRAKYRADKQIIRKEKELELKKANEVLELKNKELAASALKLIEKDENLSLLKSKIKEASGSLDVNELKKVVRSISVSNNRNWEEFEARFIAVNQDFYKRVQERFPKLSQRDLKLCALIKLNFSSKEMAKLLGISVESAHTSRYRLRKKMQLTRDVNLTEFIANL